MFKNIYIYANKSGVAIARQAEPETSIALT